MTDHGSGWPTAINERGQVVGYRLRNEFHSFLRENGKKVDLGTLPGEIDSVAAAINTQGQIVGRAFSGTIRDRVGVHAFLWQEGKMRDLGTLGGDYSDAVAINERGQIVGDSRVGSDSQTVGWATHAFLWQKGKMTDLGTLGGKNSGAVAINDQGQIVGWATTKTGNTHAVLCTARHLTVPRPD